MTLIASYRIGEVPVILGDIMTSREVGLGTEQVSLPTVHNVNGHLKEVTKLRIAGTAQKVNIISDQLVIAWCGSKAEAENFVSYLKNHIGQQPLTPDYLQHAFNHYQFRSSVDLSVIVYLFANNNLYHWGLGIPPFYLDNIEDIYIGGTGQEAFWGSLQQLNQIRSVGEGTKLDHAVMRAQGLSATWFSNQLTRGIGIDRGWGGGFEVAYCRKGVFEKLSDQLFLFWKVRKLRDGSCEITSFPLFIKSDYQEKSLRFLVCDWSESQAEERLYFINPLGEELQGKPTVPTLNYSWLINCFEFENEDGEKWTGVNCGRFTERNKPVKIDATPNAYTIGFHDTHFKNLLRQQFFSGSGRSIFF